MVAAVVDDNEVSINGVFYPTTRPVQAVLASLYPPKVTIGDTTRDSQSRSSVISWSDWRGGLGIERMEGAADVDKTCNKPSGEKPVLPTPTFVNVALSVDSFMARGFPEPLCICFKVVLEIPLED